MTGVFLVTKRNGRAPDLPWEKRKLSQRYISEKGKLPGTS